MVSTAASSVTAASVCNRHYSCGEIYARRLMVYDTCCCTSSEVVPHLDLVRTAFVLAC